MGYGTNMAGNSLASLFYLQKNIVSGAQRDDLAIQVAMVAETDAVCSVGWGFGSMGDPQDGFLDGLRVAYPIKIWMRTGASPMT